MTDNSASPPHKFAVGDTVTLVRTHRRYKTDPSNEIETTVTKVGRKYFWVEAAPHWQKFHLSTGKEESNFTASDYVTTPELRALEVRRAELVKLLRERGVELRNERAWSVENLARLAAAAGDA